LSLADHRREAPARLGFGVLTISDTRDEAADRGGAYLVEAVARAGHRLAWRGLVRDEAEDIARAVREAVAQAGVDLLLTTGGTGIAPRDVTVPTLERMFEGAIPGFGELFRWLSYQEIGSAAMLSRAAAGLVGGKVVLALPGSPKALRLALEKLVLPEAGHLVAQARGPAPGGSNA
jgi:molybdenum cofactor biosynthesis protein B